MSSFPETYNNLKLQNGAFYMAHILFYLFRRIILLKTSDTGLNYCQHDVLSFHRGSIKLPWASQIACSAGQ